MSLASRATTRWETRDRPSCPIWTVGHTAAGKDGAPVLQVEQLGRRFGSITALHDVSIQVTAGARHAVIGPNGAGKTTLINLIAGTLRPTSGTIRLAGHDITGVPAYLRARQGIGRTWQHPAVFARLSVADNVTLALPTTDTRSRTEPVLRQHIPPGRVAALLEQAGLDAYATTPAGRMPYGLQRRLELAMALAARPALLLLDEPSAGLDPDELSRLADLLAALRKDEVTVILVDHNLELIWAAADTVTVLHHGRHLTTGTPDQVRAHPHVQAAYLTPTSSRTSNGRATTTRRRGDRGHRAGVPTGLQVSDLRAGYHGHRVLDGLDLQVGLGETVAVLGRNGAGKTTLLNALAGLLPVHSGQITMLGMMSVTRWRPDQRSRAGIALVPQGRRLFASLTVAEHLTCARAAHRRSRDLNSSQRWTMERVLDLLPALAARAHQPARLLSGGEQQMLAPARALMTNPTLLLLDEPSEGLAPSIVEQLTTVLADLTASGLAVLVAEQNLPLATAIADRIVLLHAGRVAMTCTSKQLTDSPDHQRRLRILLGVGEPVDIRQEATSTQHTPERRP